MLTNKSVSITMVAEDHTMFGSPVNGPIHVTEFEGEEIRGGQFFKTMQEAFALSLIHISEPSRPY